MRCRSAALALVVLVLGQLSAWAHDGSVRHVVCAQHGELIEAPRLARAEASGSWLIAVEDSAAGDEHCTLESTLHQHAAPCAAPALIVALPAVVVALAAIVTRHLELDFRIAPKTSPPGR